MIAREPVDKNLDISQDSVVDKTSSETHHKHGEHLTTHPWLTFDHYNQTRGDYYRRLDLASRAGDVAGFLRYAAEGFVDELRSQIQLVQQQQVRVSWVNYVHERFASKPNTDATARQRTLLLALPSEPVPVTELRRMTPLLAELYAIKGDKTLTRDVNELVGMGLAIKEKHTLRSAIGIMRAFIPGRPEADAQH